MFPCSENVDKHVVGVHGLLPWWVEHLIIEVAMKVCIASLLLWSLAVSCVADTYKCEQSNGKYTYQNWPCGTKPEIEKKPKGKPDYVETVKCGMQSGATNAVRNATGGKSVPSNCSAQ